jgi:hypothetical protein
MYRRHRTPAEMFVAAIVLILIRVRDSIHDEGKIEITAHECGIETLGTHELSPTMGATVILPPR